MEIKELSAKRILVLGLGKEGTSTLKYIRKKYPQKQISVADQKKLSELGQDTREQIAKDRNLKLYMGGNFQNIFDEFDIIFKSPGIKITKSTKARITSQTKIFFNLYKERIVGVTGTKGKTTTASLIYEILKDSNIKVHLLGNVGNPPFDYMGKIRKGDVFVYELSSFQLQDLKTSPHIAVFLNLFEEHLDYHGGLENYKLAKTNIVRWQNKKDFIIYNADSPIVTKIVKKYKAYEIPFSSKDKLKAKAYTDGEWLFFKGEKVLKISETKLKGKFNLNNILAAVSCAKVFKVSNQSIAYSVKNFKPIEHRLEYIGNFCGIDFYDDSIATIPEATIAALETLTPNIATLIAGGYDRGVNYSLLSKKIVQEEVQNVILFPTTGKILLEEIKKQKRYLPRYFFVKSMKEAVKIAVQNTKRGEICLLSPASSSFNLFKDYKDRGLQFKKEVMALI